MMKHNKWFNSIIQIGLIMLASLVVVGATWQIGQSSGTQTIVERGGEFDGDNRERPEHDHADRPDGGRGRGDHHAADLSLRGIAGFGETIIKMGVIMTLIIFGQRAWEMLLVRRANRQ